jgi:CubicO group peptidase (beta-lactamase class C family)
VLPVGQKGGGHRHIVEGVSPRVLPALELVREKAEKFLDQLVPERLAAHCTGGAAVAIVRQDRVVLSKGYGLADLVRGRPVEDSTLFRVGSVSKVLTWTAVMQQVGRGLLDPTKDIGEYLDFVLPRKSQEPITLRHLMTHSAGFESNCFGYMATWTAAASQSLALSVSAHVPSQVRAPGRLAVYDNWGAAAAGRIVEVVSGLAFDDYIDQHLLGPLQMSRSTFREPVPAGFGPAPIGHVFDGSDIVEHPFEHYHSVAPAGSFTTTAADMANFMRAHLLGGHFGGARILTEEAALAMQVRAPGFHSLLDGATLGFYETWRNGRRTIGHGGATVSFESRLTLLPDEQVGIFVACNTGTGSGFCDAIVQALIDHFFPCEIPVMAFSPGFRHRASSYCGRYAFSPQSHTKSEKLFGRVHAIDVRANADRLMITGLTNEDETEWTEIAGSPGVFRLTDGQEIIAFEEGGDGRRYILGPEPFNPAESVDLLGSVNFTRYVHLTVPSAFAVCGGLAFVHGIPQWPIVAWLAAALALINILIIAGIVRTLGYDQYSLLVRSPWPFAFALVLGLPSTLLSATVAVSAVAGWAFFEVGPMACGSLGALAVLSLGFAYWLKYWNLIGFNYA